MDSLTYKEAGVDIDKADRMLDSFSEYLRSRPKDPNVVSGIGGFASCYDLQGTLRKFKHPLLVTCCDGVGTKIKLALDWNRVDGLGEDLVAMNVNDLLCCGASPLLFLDYFACGALKEEMGLRLLKSIQKGCELSGCALVGGETAEMPGMYTNEDFDLAGFAVGLVEKDLGLGAHKVQIGDRLVALESSGPHSNGFSLLRKLADREKLQPDAKVPFGSTTWKETLLKPTTIYVPYLKGLLSSIHGLAHITGGGLFENLPRVLPDATVAAVSSLKWPLPPLFSWIQDKSGLPLDELLRTLNCGVGMIAVCPSQAVDRFCEDLNRKGLRSWDIGAVEEGKAGTPACVTWK